MAIYAKRYLAVFIVVILLAGGCTAKSKLETIYTGSLLDAQTIYINQGNVYIPNGDNLEKINENGKETVLSRQDLDIFMDFGAELKTIGIANKYLLLDVNEKIIRQITTIDRGAPFLSKNGQALAIIDSMEEVTKVFSTTDGTLLWDFKNLKDEVDITDDGKILVTSDGEILDLETKARSYIPDCISYQSIRIIDSSILFGSISGCVTVYDFAGKLKWVEDLNGEYCRLTLIKESKIIIYTEDSVLCLDVKNGQKLWEQSYDELLLNVLSRFNEADYAIFQTNDQMLHVLDENGKEIATKPIGKVYHLSYGEDLLVIHRKGVEPNIEVIKIIE